MTMDDWIDYYDSTHTIYVEQAASRRAFPASMRAMTFCRLCHFARCGRARLLPAARRCSAAHGGGRLRRNSILAEPAPGVRGRLTARFGAEHRRFAVRSLDDLAQDAGEVDRSRGDESRSRNT
jgi:hypothetical protein